MPKAEPFLVAICSQRYVQHLILDAFLDASFPEAHVPQDIHAESAVFLPFLAIEVCDTTGIYKRDDPVFWTVKNVPLAQELLDRLEVVENDHVVDSGVYSQHRSILLCPLGASCVLQTPFQKGQVTQDWQPFGPGGSFNPRDVVLFLNQVRSTTTARTAQVTACDRGVVSSIFAG